MSWLVWECTFADWKQSTCTSSITPQTHESLRNIILLLYYDLERNLFSKCVWEEHQRMRLIFGKLTLNGGGYNKNNNWHGDSAKKKHNQWKHTKPQNKPHSITPYNTAIQHKQHITSRTHTHQHLLTKPPPRGLPHPLGVQAKGIQRHHNGAWAAVGRVILGVELLRQLEEVAQPWGGEDLSQHKIHRALIYLLKLYSSH